MLSQELINVAAQLIYERWSREYDALKHVKEEKNDGSPDWPLFHAERLKRHKAEEALWKGYLAEITPLHTIGKG